MSVMTLGKVWPMEDRPLTVDDLERLPDDGCRYEIVDGVLEVTPAPLGNHERAVARLEYLLQCHCSDEFEVLGGAGVNLAPDLHRIPDLIVIREELFEGDYQTKPPVLAIEVASRSTRKRDRTKKFREYEAFGIESYWIVEPEFDHPNLTAYELAGGRYKQVALVAGNEVFHADKPFSITIVPDMLLAPGKAWRSGLG
jgi:Uma2 family endonuclease